ncbi:MAG: hypothetical protein P8M72_05785 [Gammaproteobacteria bacterium]|nr:hypothetical protein [Gammaproteobacteria bacterium]
MSIRLFVLLVLAGSFSLSTQAQDCDRSCLADFLDQYLDAIIASDASQAPLSYGFRQTENSIVVPNDEGLWTTVTSLGELQRRYFDPVGQTAGYFGLLEESGERAAVSLRMKVSNNLITEAEWHIGRENDLGLQGVPGTVYWNADELIANPPNGGFVPLDKRYSRDDLIAIANSYFDGIIAQNSKVIKGHPGCSRRENGQSTFGGPLAPGATGFNGTSDCRTSGDFGLAQVAARRVQVVDVEQQIAMVSVVFLRRPGNERWRNHFTEVFSIEDGLIRHVHAAMFYAHPTQPVPNWPPYNGNLPLSFDETQ